eukprot:TRINITY_DN57_c4_g1_i1.p1 TRINITY_DN57_c4_g1~~TRINITY_DN57_c4_g1_i1.p1  ORF type:complete len:731 (+),score=194.97 TRINITY_DN57_c4_g1_i1:44-2236(+)
MTDARVRKEEIHSRKFERDSKMGRVYVKQKRLGQGAFGEGWLCADRIEKRMVVVKIGSCPILSDKEEYNAKKEVCIMQAMNHPNVVKFYEAWIERNASGDERLHIAMEYCDSGDIGSLLKKKLNDDRNLRILSTIANEARKQCGTIIKGHYVDDLLCDKDLFNSMHSKVTHITERIYTDTVEKEGRINSWSLAELESWLVQLLWGIWYIHKKKVVHRDIKPDNIFLTGGGKIIKIGDFGVSGLQAHTNANLSTRAGTPLYMAPEMWDGGSYTDRVDVFALGIMFYELCGLVRAYEATFPMAEKWGGAWSARSIKFLKRQIVYPTVRPMHLPQKQIEASFFEVIKTMIRKDPKVRPTAGQVLRSIRMQAVARRVLETFRDAGMTHGGDPLVQNTDQRHQNIYNPANNQYTLHDTARFQCSSHDSEVLMMTSRSTRLSIRERPSFEERTIGYLTNGDIVEVMERVAHEGVEWLKFEHGYCIAKHDGKRLMTPCPEDLLCRDEAGMEVLGAYGAVLQDVHGLLKDALRDRIDKAKGSAESNLKEPKKAARRSSSPVAVGVVKRNCSPARRASSPAVGKPAGPAPQPQPKKAPVMEPFLQRNSPVKRRPSNSPVVKRLSAPQRRTSSPVRRCSSPVRSPITRPARTPSPVRKEEVKLPAKKLKEQVITRLGKDEAKRLYQEYFGCYESCIAKGKMKPGGTCQQLQKYELALHLKLGNDGNLVSNIRKCAEMQFQ